MIQCILCEDWYHSRHLNASVPKSNSFAEMICGDCMSRNEIISHYVGLSITKLDETDLDVTVDPDVSLLNQTSEQLETSAAAEKCEKSAEGKADETLLKDEINQSISDTVNQSIMNIIEMNKSNNDTTDASTSSSEPPAKRQKTEGNEVQPCKKPLLIGEKTTGATFWPNDWRKSICTCQKCYEELKQQKIEFLIDLEDTVLSYQEKGLAKTHETSEERAMRAFSQIDPRQQINVLTGYNKLKEGLKEFLHSYAMSNNTVTIEDVNRFFRMMNEKDGK